jgi:hypothetical protein
MLRPHREMWDWRLGNVTATSHRIDPTPGALLSTPIPTGPDPGQGRCSARKWSGCSLKGSLNPPPPSGHPRLSSYRSRMDRYAFVSTIVDSMR